MFISLPESGNYYDEILVSSTDKFPKSIDIISNKRNLILFNDFDIRKSVEEGVHSIKASIINLSVVDGRYHYDSCYNPEIVLVKTVYNGYILVPIETKIKGEVKVTKEFLSKSFFSLITAYTSHMGVWNTNNSERYDSSSPLGVSLLSMHDIKYASLNARKRVNPISILGDHASIKLEITFNGEDYITTLPLPHPMYYTGMHAESNGDSPIITRNDRICYDDLCDFETKVSLINFNRKGTKLSSKYNKYDPDNTSELSYLDNNDIKFNPAEEPGFPVRGFALLGTLSDSVFSSIFKLFYKFQLSKFDFLYDSTRDIINVESINFSYSNPPTDIAKSVVFSFLDDCNIINALNDIVLSYGDATIIGRITDLKFDLSIKFKESHKMIPRLKTINYSTTIFDIFNSLSSFDTSISNPIVMFN